MLQRAQEDAFALVLASVHEWAAHEGGRRGHVRVEQPIACDKVARGVGAQALEHRFVVDQGSQLGAEHLPLGAIRCDQVQSGAIRGASWALSTCQSGAIGCNQVRFRHGGGVQGADGRQRPCAVRRRLRAGTLMTSDDH